MISTLLASSSWRCYNKTLAKSIGAVDALVISEIADRQDFYSRAEKLDEEGFFFATYEEMAEELGLGQKQVLDAVRRLTETGIVDIKMAGMPKRKHYRINEEKIASVLESAWPSKKDGQERTKRTVKSVQKGGANNIELHNENSKIEDTSLRSVSLVADAPQKEESKTKKFLDSIQAFIENGRLESAEYSEVARTVAERMGEDFEKVARELPKFANYWTQTNENGRKQKWEKEKTFDLVKRFRYWLMNAKDSGRWREKHVSSIVF